MRFFGVRYTIRAKRGGSQSSYDSGGRKAQSAGAALRRYGEQALREDIRALLKEWEGPLKVRYDEKLAGVLYNSHSAPLRCYEVPLRIFYFDQKAPEKRTFL